MPRMKENGIIAQGLIFIILIISLIVTVYLITSGNPLKLLSHASQPAIVFKDINNKPLANNPSGIPITNSSSIKIELTSTLGGPKNNSASFNLFRIPTVYAQENGASEGAPLKQNIAPTLRRLPAAILPPATPASSSPSQSSILSPIASTAPISSPSSPSTYTVSYKIAESPTELSTAVDNPYTEQPTVLNYTFKDQTVGTKFVWVEFKDNNGKVARQNAQIEYQVVANTPKLIASEKKRDGIDANGKLETEEAEFLARVDPAGYQKLVQKGLIADPAAVGAFIQKYTGQNSNSNPHMKTHLSSDSTITSCGEITSPGNYTLSSDLTGSLFATDPNPCIYIHDTNNVNLDCQNHQITTVTGNVFVITNVQNFSLKNCITQLKDTTASGGSMNITNSSNNITNGSNGVIQNNTFSKMYINVKGSNYLQIFNNINTGGSYQQSNSSFNQIHDNTIKEVPDNSACIVTSTNGHNNSIQNNILDGHWNGQDHGSLQDYKGSDDGICFENEDQDIFSGNTISNNWDCGIETLGIVKNTKITNNKISNSGLCGIGGWYSNSWLSNTVDSNIVDGAEYMFYFYYHNLGLLSRTNEQYVYFKDNEFNNNTFLHQRATAYVGGDVEDYSAFIILYLNYDPPAELPTKFENNIFKNNDFDQTLHSPFITPTSMVVDQGGNKCLTIHDDLPRPLTCVTTSAPSPSPSPSIAPASCTACSADLSGDGRVSILDYSISVTCVNAGITGRDGTGRSCIVADIDKNGVVDKKDLDCVSSQFGKTCTP